MSTRGTTEGTDVSGGDRDDVLITESVAAAPALRLPITMVALLIAVLLAGIAVVATRTTSPTKFTSRAVLLIDQPGLVAASNSDGVLLKLSRLRVKFVDVANTSVVLERAAEATGFPVGALRAASTVTAPPLSLTLVVTAVAPTNDQAITVANAVAEATSSFADEDQAFDEIPPGERVHLEIIEPASFAARSGGSSSRPLTIGVLTALVAFVLSYAAIQIMASRPRST